MEDSKFIITGNNIVATNVHIGDKNYYNSANEFNSNNPQLTKEERDLVDIIFENTSSKEERQQILESLRNISKGEVIGEEKKNIFKIGLDKLQKLLIKTSEKIAEKVVTAYVEQHLKNS